MKKVIIIKYGELSLKKGNKNYFLITLKNNISNLLHSIKHEINYDYGRMFIYVDEENIDLTIDILKNVFGIYEIIIGYIDSDKNIDVIKNRVWDLVKDMEFTSFKVSTKRSDKTYPILSMDVSRQVASIILRNKDNLTVDLTNPEFTINIEIRNKEILYYTNGIKGLGGYPVGTLGKGLLMLSGGIDSPVAGYLAIKKGVKLEAIYFDSPPHTSLKAKQKVTDLVKVLSKYNTSIKLHVINFTKIQEEILKNIPHEYLITIMRRMMYRISAIVASRGRMDIIVNGESIGQVASQTLKSMKCINEVISIPVIRPVACFDKSEIMALAEKIGTYDISIRPYIDCCTIFVPDHPVINPDVKLCREYEKLIPYEDMIYEAVKNQEVIKINENYNEDDFNSLL